MKLPVAPQIILDLIQQAYDATNDIYYTYDAESSVLAFRGTEDIKDWQVDALAVPQHYDLQIGTFTIHGGKVHAGFLRRWEQIRGSVFTAIGTTPRPIIITGHSLGGAIATLCAIELRALDWQVQLVTVGTPRVGNSEFARMLDHNLKNYVRIEHWLDPVPWIPRIFGWSHAGKRKYVGFLHFRWPLVRNHFLESYRKALKIADNRKQAAAIKALQ